LHRFRLAGERAFKTPAGFDCRSRRAGVLPARQVPDRRGEDVFSVQRLIFSRFFFRNVVVAGRGNVQSQTSLPFLLISMVSDGIFVRPRFGDAPRSPVTVRAAMERTRESIDIFAVCSSYKLRICTGLAPRAECGNGH
jgi:hypothetical protein